MEGSIALTRLRNGRLSAQHASCQALSSAMRDVATPFLPSSLQVWNKTVRPSPKLEVHGDWRSSTDELHAILIHSDSWQPRFGVSLRVRGAAAGYARRKGLSIRA
eukprot:1994777-Pleurochrysis_carterae.AAC.2